MSVNQIEEESRYSGMPKMTLDEVQNHPTLVAEILSEQHQAEERMAQLQLRPLSRGLRGLIWFLRIYVIFMIIVVTINVVHTVQ